MGGRIMGGFNYIQAIGAELQKADQLAAEIPCLLYKYPSQRDAQ